MCNTGLRTCSRGDLGSSILSHAMLQGLRSAAPAKFFSHLVPPKGTKIPVLVGVYFPCPDPSASLLPHPAPQSKVYPPPPVCHSPEAGLAQAGKGAWNINQAPAQRSEWWCGGGGSRQGRAARRVSCSLPPFCRISAALVSCILDAPTASHQNHIAVAGARMEVGGEVDVREPEQR